MVFTILLAHLSVVFFFVVEFVIAMLFSQSASQSVSEPDLFVCYANFIDGLKMEAINLNTYENMHAHFKNCSRSAYIFCCCAAMSHI